MPNAKDVFKSILNNKKWQPTVIFDLDSTLYNVSHRTQKIIYNFADEVNIRKQYPIEAQKLKSVIVKPGDWGMREALLRANFSAPPELIIAIKDYWKTHFFSSDLLHEDIPYPGAVDYVNALFDVGVQVHYLTGRDAQNMHSGTVASLKYWKFPTHNLDKILMMKPYKGSAEDEDFKANKIRDLKSNIPTTWFFENEPVIINKVKEALPDIKIVWLDTTHSKKASPPENVSTIRQYDLPHSQSSSG